MRSTKIALHLAALGLGTALLAVGAQAQDTYPIGRGANDGGFVQAKPGNSGQQNGPRTGGERQFSWEGNDAAYGGQYRGGGQYGGGLYNSAPSVRSAGSSRSVQILSRPLRQRRRHGDDAAGRKGRRTDRVSFEQRSLPVRQRDLQLRWPGPAASESAGSLSLQRLKLLHRDAAISARSRNERADLRSRQPFLTALTKLAKKSSATFFAAPLIRRWPSCASLPPICASTS